MAMVMLLALLINSSIIVQEAPVIIHRTINIPTATIWKFRIFSIRKAQKSISKLPIIARITIDILQIQTLIYTITIGTLLLLQPRITAIIISKNQLKKRRKQPTVMLVAREAIGPKNAEISTEETTKRQQMKAEEMNMMKKEEMLLTLPLMLTCTRASDQLSKK
jgi:hypothetical protein